jgi:hypothetical protein
VDSGTERRIQGQKGGFGDREVDSGTKMWIQEQRGGFRDREVDLGTDWWIQGQRGGFRVIGVDSGKEEWIQVELKRTPVGLYLICKKHSKKVQGLTQNTMLPHGYLRQGLT